MVLRAITCTGTNYKMLLPMSYASQKKMYADTKSGIVETLWSYQGPTVWQTRTYGKM